MIDRAEGLSTLAPSPLEVGMSLLVVVDAVLVTIVLVQVLRGRLALPHGVLGLVPMLLLPVVGPVLVLTWQGRVERHRARTQHASA